MHIYPGEILSNCADSTLSMQKKYDYDLSPKKPFSLRSD